MDCDDIPECVVLILRVEKCGKLDVPVIFVWSKAPQASRKRWQQTSRKQTQAPHDDGILESVENTIEIISDQQQPVVNEEHLVLENYCLR